VTDTEDRFVWKPKMVRRVILRDKKVAKEEERRRIDRERQRTERKGR